MKASKVVDAFAVVVTVLAVLDLIFLVGEYLLGGLNPVENMLLRTGRIAGVVGLGVFLWVASQALECLESIAESSKEACSDQTAKQLLEELRMLSVEARERKRAKMASEAEAKNAGLPVEKYPGDW